MKITEITKSIIKEDAATQIANGALSGKTVGGLTFNASEPQADETSAYSFQGQLEIDSTEAFDVQQGGRDEEASWGERTVDGVASISDGHAAFYAEGGHYTWYLYGSSEAGEFEEISGEASDPVSALKLAIRNLQAALSQ